MTQEMNWQLHIVGPEREWTFPLPEGETHIGRRPQNDVVLAHNFVSGRHARLTCHADGCTLADLESTNGTSVDGETIPAGVPLPLAEGQTITIGPFRLTLARPVEEVAAPAPPPEEEPVAEVLADPEAAPRTESEAAVEPAEIAEAATPAEAIREADPVADPGGQAAGVTRPESVPPPPPAAPPSRPPGANGDLFDPDPARTLPGLDRHSRRLLAYLPGIYHTDFMGRFLAIFESILAPIEWTVDNFDLYLSPRTAPAGFLPWLANWYTITYDASWSEGQRRTLLAEAPEIYARRGTRWALARVLQIYTGRQPEIVEFEEEDEPFTFTVRLPFPRQQLNIALLEQIIDAHKPAHTLYRLRFKGE